MMSLATETDIMQLLEFRRGKQKPYQKGYKIWSWFLGTVPNALHVPSPCYCLIYNFGSDIKRTELAAVFQFCSKICVELTCFSECVMRKLLLKILTSLFVWSVICNNSSGIINRNMCHMHTYTHTSWHVVCFWFTPTEYGFWNSGRVICFGDWNIKKWSSYHFLVSF